MTPTQPTRETKARRPRDMALSMLVLIIPVFLLVGFYRYLGHETPPALDSTEVYASVERAGQFRPLKPDDLPDGWRIASATFTDGVLRLGVTAPDNGALQIVESAKPREELLSVAVNQGARAGEALPNGWDRVTGARPGERAIVQTTGPRTVIIVGQAKDEQLQRLARSLRA